MLIDIAQEIAVTSGEIIGKKLLLRTESLSSLVHLMQQD